jgi:hypothetical protein
MDQEDAYLPKNPFIVKEYLVFGDLPGATVTCPIKGQSICGADRQYYYKDNSPTIGFYNDYYMCFFEDDIEIDTLSGIFGTLGGVVYDNHNAPVRNANFKLYTFHGYEESSYFYRELYSFSTNGNGQYSIPVLSHKVTLDYLCYNESTLVPIENVSYSMEPDSSITRDIHVNSDFAVNIGHTFSENSPVTISPNPVSTGENIRITLDLPTLTSNVWLEFIDPSGKSISNTRLQQADNTVEAPSKSGLYVARIVLDGRVITTGKILVRE